MVVFKHTYMLKALCSGKAGLDFAVLFLAAGYLFFTAFEGLLHHEV